MRRLTVTFVLLFLSVAGLNSCKKKTIQYTFQGNVTEAANNSALSGTLVEVSQRTYNGTVASTNFSAAANTMSDASGYYELSFDREKVFEFKVVGTKDGYFDFEQIIGSADVSTAEPKVIDFSLDARSWVTFHITNLGGVSSDQFTMIHYNFRTDCDGCTTNDFYYYDGIVDSTFTYQSTGGVYARYSYKNPGGSVYYQDSVYMTPFDTAYVTINY